MLVASSAQTALLPCFPCVGARTNDPEGAARTLSSRRTADEDLYFPLGWDVDLGNLPSASVADSIRAGGAQPAPRLIFRVSAPVTQFADELQVELEATAELARQLGGSALVQIQWQPREGTWNVRDYAFLLKRASVAVLGAEPDASILTEPLRADPTSIRELWAEGISAYVDIITLEPAPGEALRAATETLEEVDPGRPVLVDGLSSENGVAILVEAARVTGYGAEGAIFLLDGGDPTALAVLQVLAGEVQGDVAADPYTTPSGGREAWSFVHGSDLSLRVIVESPTTSQPWVLKFSDPQLRTPRLIDPTSGERTSVRAHRSRQGLELTIDTSSQAVLLSLERMSAQELEGLEGLEEEVDVATERQMPVSEILRRLQAVEDGQRRRLEHYQATNTSHMRFELGGARSLEVTFRGDFFYRRDGGFDWAWQHFLINGVRWRGKRVPKIPLIQPEKAAALPLEINFTRDYRYRLRGTARIRGRDCWVVEFRPAAAVEEGRSLFQGTVWVDRELYFRLRTRAIQLGLAGDVLSSEETVDYTPYDSSGTESEWSLDNFFLPTHTHGQEIFSLLNASVVVETQTDLSAITINASDFAEARQRVLDSEATMVRDTAEGLRYLISDPDTGERVVQDHLNPNRLAGAAGVLWDESFDFPIPLAGIDFLSFDFKETGTQINALFAGVLLAVSVADPDFLGSRWDAGIDLFGIAISGADTVYSAGQELVDQEIKTRPFSMSFDLGRPIGSFTKIDFTLGLRNTKFSHGDNTAPDFVLPTDHTTQSFSITGRYNRAGYRFSMTGSKHVRSEWEAWGFADNPDFGLEKDEYTLWGARLAKVWHLPRFRKIGIELQYADGKDLDRFSKYDFGLFSDIQVRGYRRNLIKATSAYATHLSYGFDLGEIIRLDLVTDAAWATDELTALEDEFLAGVGIVGTFIGPWQTIVNVDLGVAVAGPDDGISVFLTFIKLFGAI